MTTQTYKLSRTDKILLTIYKLAKGKKQNILFEDIVVQLFKDFKNDFHLRGYRQYPDSENVNKAIYSHLRRSGFVTYGNKIFTLTDKGIEYVKNLKIGLGDKNILKKERFTNFIKNELNRIIKLQGYKLFINGKEEKIIDTDFYNYLGVSVKTPKDQILGRLKTLNDLCKELNKSKDIDNKNIIKFHNYLTSKFQDIINYYKK